MKINAHTRISAILRQSPEALDAIISLNPKFNKLRNTVLRKVMSPRVSIAQAAKIGDCSPEDFFRVLQPLGFEIEDTIQNAEVEIIQQTQKPDWLKRDLQSIKNLDVRPMLEEKKDPLNHILQSLKMLQQHDILCIINSFEPTPLINMLGKKGYKYYVEKIHEDEILTYFQKQSKDDFETVNPEISTSDSFEKLQKKYAGKLVELDVTQLEMPLPMLTILENIAALPAGSALFVKHKRIPVYLLPELEDQGFQYAVNVLSENDVKLIIYKNE